MNKEEAKDVFWMRVREKNKNYIDVINLLLDVCTVKQVEKARKKVLQ